jgi:hypothetical protein
VKLGVAALVAAALIPMPTKGAAAGGNPAAALGVSPLRVELKGASTTTITVRNPGARPLVVTASRAGFARTLRGKPRIKALTGAAGWLQTRPRRLRLGSHASATLRLVAKPPAGARPGDHPALLLLTTRPPAVKTVHVLLRIGVVVLVRVSGTIVHRLVPRALTVHRDGTDRILAVRLANRGNVSEWIGGRRVALVLSNGGKRFATLHARRFDLLPHSAGIAEFPYHGAVRGPVVAQVAFRPATLGVSRTFRVTLP